MEWQTERTCKLCTFSPVLSWAPGQASQSIGWLVLSVVSLEHQEFAHPLSRTRRNSLARRCLGIECHSITSSIPYHSYGSHLKVSQQSIAVHQGPHSIKCTTSAQWELLWQIKPLGCLSCHYNIWVQFKHWMVLWGKLFWDPSAGGRFELQNWYRFKSQDYWNLRKKIVKDCDLWDVPLS